MMQSPPLKLAANYWKCPKTGPFFKWALHSKIVLTRDLTLENQFGNQMVSEIWTVF
jgi:hypothetical protein